MARLESPQKHTRDNMRVLKEIENSAYYSKLMHNMVLDFSTKSMKRPLI